MTIIGGGIAGLTVAHELARTGAFEIDVYEQRDIPGGKARSMRFADGNVGEHSIRVYLAAYGTLFQTMQEIPFEGQSAYENLVYTPLVFQRGDDAFTLPATYSSLWNHARLVVRLLRFLRRQGIPLREIAFFARRLMALLWMCDERARDTIDSISFERYLDGPKRTPAFREIVFVLPELIVAAKRTASAYIDSRILLEWFIAPFLRSPYRRQGFASLNGPTSERFLDPWVALLRERGVRFHLRRRVRQIDVTDGRVGSVTFADGHVASSDVFVVAVQQNSLAAFLTGPLGAALPSLDILKVLGQQWSNGAQFFLRTIPAEWERYVGVVTMRLDSPWSIVFAIQMNGAQWHGVPMPPGTAGVLSLAYSNAFRNGIVHGKRFNQCTPPEILDECLAQLGLTGHADAVQSGVVDPDLHYVEESVFTGSPDEYAGYVSSAIPGSSLVVATQSTLYIRDPGNLGVEPSNDTEVENLFVAGEFTKTRFALPTMEKANESGKRCAQAICSRVGLPYDVRRINGSALPLSRLRALDRWLYRFQRGMRGRSTRQAR